MDNNRYFPLASGSIPLTRGNSSTVSSNPYHLLTQPQLVILSHKTHADELVSRNGLQRSIHVVVKNSPFSFTLGVTNSNMQKADLNQIAFQGHLLYDCEGDKEVDFVKVKPVDFKFTPTDNGERLECEVRIKVLTSQHEDMLFKVKVTGHHPITHAEIPGMVTISSPIKVISKPEQLKKAKQAAPVANVPATTGKKRSNSEVLAEAVARIEAKQEEQQKLITRLLQQQNETSVLLEKKQRTKEPTNPSWGDVLVLPSISLQQEKLATLSAGPLPGFDDAFANMIRAYNAMTPEEKPEVIRKLIRGLSPREIERLSELLDLFWTEGLQKELGAAPRMSHDAPFSTLTKANEGCSCAECPHKLELEKIDEFYKEFLSTGYNPPPPY
jgi:hypothetical protein